jgi:hypothetical protein
MYRLHLREVCSDARRGWPRGRDRGMDFRVLGTLEVWTAQGRVALPSARHRRVLAGLLLAPNSVVPLSRLVEATWDDEPPATATKQIQNCVSALRERFGDSDQRLLVTEGSGYRIVVDEQQLDLLRFNAGVADARRFAAGGLLDEGVREIRSALRLWRGPALDGIGTAVLAGRAARLDEQRLDALEASRRVPLGSTRSLSGRHGLVPEAAGGSVQAWTVAGGGVAGPAGGGWCAGVRRRGASASHAGRAVDPTAAPSNGVEPFVVRTAVEQGV